uniref:ribosomal protein S4 n=1 Tax=Streptofilum capillatum TaxID=2058781 RepID=UPI00286ACD97|nr:ribosomal protein S4 [Streptofilum capillatum]WKT08543.1 ribosomal protein S4 [Streptofilum capillatum]WKT08642.1 ribosomal protein S4 [Streptofilum sp. BC4-VF8pt]WKT08741.1 ribosomal protein S4 [Streptofilum sp. ZNP2-VF4pt]
MSRYRGPRIRILRRVEEELPGLTNKTRTQSNRWQGKTSKNLKRRPSQYSISLKEKQKLRYNYGITERQLLNYVRLARKIKGSTGQVLLQLLEMRLDNILFRLNMAPTVIAARQIVNHRHVLVNDQLVDIPSYRCKPKDVIKIKQNKKSYSLIKNNLERSTVSKLPNHLMLDDQNYVGTIRSIASRENIPLQLNELLVVEYYSRKA